MQSKTHTLKINTSKILPIGFDVGKSNLDYYLEILQPDSSEVKAVSGKIANRVQAILTALEELHSLAIQNGFENIGVLCESTGVYSDKLLRLARQQGHFTAYVNGEAVYKLKVLENNDAGKTDIKDPRVILMVAKMDKILLHRPLTGDYLALREYNRAFDEERKQITGLKGHIHALLVRLFPDLDFSAQFLYKNTGKALYNLYGWNPHRIIEEGYPQFLHNMKVLAPGVNLKTLEELWENAQSSCFQAMEKVHLEAMEVRLAGFWEGIDAHEKRLTNLSERIVAIYRKLLAEGERVPKTVPGFLSELRIARILGETGPLTDYHSVEALLKYAGLNLRERSSGQFKGAVRLSKKGRAPLRRTLSEAAFRLVKKDELFGPYYHGKKEKGMNGTKILVAVERKLLRLFYTLGIKAVAFDPTRVAVCESMFKKAA